MSEKEETLEARVERLERSNSELKGILYILIPVIFVFVWSLAMIYIKADSAEHTLIRMSGQVGYHNLEIMDKEIMDLEGRVSRIEFK